MVDSPVGPADAAYWAQQETGWDDVPGDWQFFVLLPAKMVGDYWATLEELGRLESAMSRPRLPPATVQVPLESDPLPGLIRKLCVCGDQVRWITDAELGCTTAGGGLYVYPQAMLGPTRDSEPLKPHLTDTQTPVKQRRTIRRTQPRTLDG